MLDVRRLRVLREVAARGTIAAAARSLAYTPSAVSQQLSALEREAGVALLDRGGGRIALTEAGRGLVRRTEGILDDLEAAEAELEATASLVGGTVRIACFPSAARALLAPALVALRERHPQLDARLEELEPEASLPALRMGEVDVAISHENARHTAAGGAAPAAHRALRGAAAARAARAPRRAGPERLARRARAAGGRALDRHAAGQRLPRAARGRLRAGRLRRRGSPTARTTSA